MNYQFHKGIGKYLAWTGGPFEFLIYPMAIGWNLEVALVFQLAIWIVFFSILSYFIYQQKTPFLQVLMFAVLFPMGAATSENFLFYLGVCLLFVSSYAKTWYPAYIGFLASIVLALLIKFSMAMSLIGVGSAFIILFYFGNERKKTFHAAMLGMIITPIIFCVLYLSYHPSLQGLFSFFKGSLQIASGYNVAMSFEGRPADLTIATIILLLYALFLIFLGLSLNKEAFRLALCVFPAFFIAFKHGFVRHDAHAIMFLTSVTSLFGLIALFMNISRTREYIIMAMSVLIILICWNNMAVYYWRVNWFEYYQLLMKRPFQRFHELRHFSLIKERLRNRDALKSEILPAAWLNSIGNAKVGIFPCKLTYAAVNDINYEPFPVFQAYAAYTDYLDTLNATYLNNTKTAPTFILMEWMAIDGRHPLADVPAMWLSMYKWYDTYLAEGEKLLLKRRETPRFTDVIAISKKNYRKDATIEIPESNHPVLIRINMRLNTIGHLAKFLFKIPEVKMSLTVGDYGHSDFRTIPDVLSDGLVINYLPSNLEEVDLLFQNTALQKMSALKIIGKGRRFYQDDIHVEFFVLPDLIIDYKTIPAITDLNVLPYQTLYAIDVINGQIVHQTTELIKISQQAEVLTITGWAVDSAGENLAGGIYLEIDGKLYLGQYGHDRNDVAIYLKIPAYSNPI